MSDEYSGWTNYETWNVKLWIDNDQRVAGMVAGLGLHGGMFYLLRISPTSRARTSRHVAGRRSPRGGHACRCLRSRTR